MISVRRSPPEAIRRPSGLTARLRTPSGFPLSVRISRPVAASQILIALSSPPEMICRPSGVHATQRTRFLCPLSVRKILTGGEVPDLERFIPAPRDKPPAIRAEGQAVDLVGVSAKDANKARQSFTAGAGLAASGAARPAAGLTIASAISRPRRDRAAKRVRRSSTMWLLSFGEFIDQGPRARFGDHGVLFRSTADADGTDDLPLDDDGHSPFECRDPAAPGEGGVSKRLAEIGRNAQPRSRPDYQFPAFESALRGKTNLNLTQGHSTPRHRCSGNSGERQARSFRMALQTADLRSNWR